jgi:hypothetical protein
MGAEGGRVKGSMGAKSVHMRPGMATLWV